jgi:predicted GNAT family acetyltransferase
LGAVGVIPEHRKHGIGTRLVEKGLSLARHGGWVAVFASGYPTWHRRFGFSTCDAARFSAETTINDLAVLSPRGARLPMETGYIRFPSALGGSLPVSNREEPAGGMNTPTCTPFLDPSCGSCSLGPGNTGANR